MDSGLVLIGLLCSSFVAINKATNRRFEFDALGDQRVAGVRVGNALTSRMLNLKSQVPSLTQTVLNKHHDTWVFYWMHLRYIYISLK